MSLLPLRELYDTTVEFFALRSLPLVQPASPCDSDSEAHSPLRHSRTLTPVPDPIAKLTRECASLREKLDTAAIANACTCSPSSSGSRVLAPMSLRRDLEEARRDLSHAKTEMSKLEARCRLLEKMLKDTKSLLKARDAEIASRARERRRSAGSGDDAKRRSGDVEMTPSTLVDEEKALSKSTEVFMTKSDSWSGAQVLQAVQDLNSEILQFAASATELSTFDKPSHSSLSSKATNQAVQETASRLGPNLARILSTRDHSQDPMLVQLALQGCISTCVARALTPFCMGFPSKPDGILSQIYAHMFMAESQPTSSRWRALTHRHIHTMYPYLNDYSINELSETMYRWSADILFIAGCPTTDRYSLSTREGMRARFGDQIKRIAKTVSRLAQVTREEIMSTRFEIIAVENDGGFDSRRMTDAFGEYGSSRGAILITTEVGLRCNTRKDSPDKVDVDGPTLVPEIAQRILLQPKVVLDSVVDLIDPNSPAEAQLKSVKSIFICYFQRFFLLCWPRLLDVRDARRIINDPGCPSRNNSKQRHRDGNFQAPFVKRSRPCAYRQDEARLRDEQVALGALATRLRIPDTSYNMQLRRIDVAWASTLQHIQDRLVGPVDQSRQLRTKSDNQHCSLPSLHAKSQKPFRSTSYAIMQVAPNSWHLLPQELVDAVIDQNQNDLPTLRACCLVNSSWTPSAQRHLFSHVHFAHNSPSHHYRAKSPKTSHQIQRFYDLIVEYPHLALLVKSVEVEPLLDASQEECLGLTLHKLTNLERISLDLGGYYWDELSQCMRDALLNTFKSPRITNLELREGLFFRCADFLALLGACEHLKRLSLFYLSCDDLEDIIEAPEASLPKGMNLQLDSLTLSLYEHSYLPLMHRLLQLGESMDLSRLHRLSVLTAGTGHLNERIETTKEILRLNSHSLEHLVLNVCLGEPLSKLIDVTQLRSIQVKLWWVRSDQHTDAVEWLRWLTETFGDLAKHRVEEVTFEVFYCGELTNHTEEWNKLDDVLAGMQSLMRVDVKLDRYDGAKGRWMYYNEYPASVSEDVGRILPNVARRRILSHKTAANYPS